MSYKSNSPLSPISASLMGGIGVVAAGLLATYVLFMHSLTVEPGHEVVLIDKPYFFGNEGVRSEPLKSGRTIVFGTTTGVSVNMMPRAIPVDFSDLPTSDNSLLDFSTSIQVRVTDSVKLVDKFGLEWFENNLKKPFESAFRDIAKSHTMTQIISDPGASTEIEEKLLKLLNDKARKDGLPVVVMDFNAGQGRPNAEVVAQMDKTVVEQQAAKTFHQAKLAQEQRKASEEARAAADRAYAEKMGYSTEQVVALEAIKQYSDACKVSGTTCVIMSGGAVPITLK